MGLTLSANKNLISWFRVLTLGGAFLTILIENKFLKIWAFLWNQFVVFGCILAENDARSSEHTNEKKQDLIEEKG